MICVAQLFEIPSLKILDFEKIQNGMDTSIVEKLEGPKTLEEVCGRREGKR